MAAKKKELGFFALIALFGIAVSLFVFSIGFIDPLTLSMRLLALNGYFALSIAVIMTPFLKEITLFFKKSFTKIHHYFAVAGLLLITFHPIAVFISTLTPAVLLPNFDSIYLFFFYGGIVALILIYFASGAALVRKKIVSYWRPFHALMYLALFIGVVHANVRGSDFQNFFVKILYDAMFVAALVAFGLKRWQFYRIKARAQKNNVKHQTS